MSRNSGWSAAVEMKAEGTVTEHSATTVYAKGQTIKPLVPCPLQYKFTCVRVVPSCGCARTLQLKLIGSVTSSKVRTICAPVACNCAMALAQQRRCPVNEMLTAAQDPQTEVASMPACGCQELGRQAGRQYLTKNRSTVTVSRTKGRCTLTATSSPL